MANQIPASDDLKTLLEKIQDINICMMTTTSDDDKSLRSRPMATQKPEPDHSLLFLTDKDSAKVYEVQKDAYVGLSYSNPDDNVYVSVSGRCNAYRDQAKINELWREDLKAWFPEGKEDPNIMILKVEIDKGEYWDSPSGLLSRAYAYARAVATGEKSDSDDVNEHAKINVR